MNITLQKMNESLKIKTPKAERLEEVHLDKGGTPVRAVTSNRDRTKWYWNDINADGTLTRIQTAKSPIDFEREKFFKKILNKG